jgi:primary-amine oxidase
MSLAVTVTHPLDPLTAEEIAAAVAAVRAAHELERPTFSMVALVDPPKEAVVAFAAGDAIERRARVTVRDRATRRTYEAVVALGAEAVETWRELEGVQPPIVDEDFARAAEGALADERFVAALRRRGIEDLGIVQVDPLSAGHFPQNPAGRRIVWATPYLKPHRLANAYSSPIEHLRASVDLDTGEVIDVVDDDPIVPVSTADGDYETEEAVGGWRDDVAPLDIVQPDGPGFTLEGNVLRWQDWRLHVALHPVDGLVLSDLRFRDGDEERQVLYRASLSEMVVPYGDPHDGFYWRTYFDAGEYGMGRLTNSLKLGCDCLGEIRYLDAVLPDGAGEPQTIENAICIHEEDAGVLWKHTELASGLAHVRRARKLVVSFFATVGNYDYGFYWSLFQDGTIELEAKLTGIVLTRGVTPEQELSSSTRVAPDLAAPHHQHLFNVRLDMAVDGFENSVQEVDLVAAEAGPENPYDQAIVTRVTPIRSESDGRRHIDAAAARTWHVVNPGRTNHVGEHPGYKLVPFNGPTMLASPDSSVGRRAGFAHANLWVTRFDPEEMHAAGEHPNQHPGGAGLPEWVAQDRPLESEDVVLWHTFGVSHAVRPEDWPVMPVERIGFALRPVGFFARNPSMRVPPPEHGGHCHHP